MTHNIHIHTVHITEANNWEHFQFTLPRDARKIIGIRTTVSGIIQALPIDEMNGTLVHERQRVLGEIKLQVLQSADWFYAESVMNVERNLGAADYSRSGFKVQPATHGGKQFPTSIELDLQHHIITGVYKDLINGNLNTPFAYHVNVYVWYDVLTTKT
jgi:hypothetical protein